MTVAGSVLSWFTGSNEVGSELSCGLQVALKGVGHVSVPVNIGNGRERGLQFLTVVAISSTNRIVLSHTPVIWLVEVIIDDLEISAPSIFLWIAWF